MALAPRTRGDCLDGGAFSARPCLFSACRHHLESDRASCALDVASEGGRTLKEVGDIFGVSRERIRQIEARALASLLRVAHARGLEEAAIKRSNQTR